MSLKLIPVLLAASSVISAAQLTFSLQDTAGKTHASVDLRQYKATVFIFVATDCPNSNTYAPEKAGPQGHLPLLFLRRQDRRPRSERLRQVLPAAHPGRRRQGLPRRDRALAGAHGRIPRTGAAARPGEDRPRRSSRRACSRSSICSRSSTRSTTPSAIPTPTWTS